MVSQARDEFDAQVRVAASNFLTELRQVFGTEMPRKVLEKGFDFNGRRVPLVGPPGIWKPAVLHDAPLSITTAPPTDRKDAPYDDELGEDGVLSYRYRGTDPSHRDNVGLRLARKLGLPLVYFVGTVEGWYEAIWPVYVLDDDPDRLTFTLMVGHSASLFTPAPGESQAVITELRRYATREVQQRLHQRVFRGQVIRAYANGCAICRLRRRELLEAAHILGDTHERGQPVVPNGVAMCPLHHTAYDRNVLGITPDFVVEVRGDVLRDTDGPMLVHGLQEFQGAPLFLPRRQDERPNQDFLKERYNQFRRAS
jgi:putative restriction endonuclease